MMTPTQTAPVLRSRFEVESTEKFAQFLAGENFQVIHDPTAETASWNIKGKILTLPTWGNCSNHVWDLLTAHEVGHVIYTPKDCFERAIKEIDSKRPNLSADVMNIIEDMRIEKLMQRKYPGLGPTWYYGYTEVLAEGHLGYPADATERKKYMATAGVQNRFNAEAKFGQLGLLSFGEVPFSAKEKEVYDLCIAAETFDEVMTCGVKLVELIKDEFEKKTGKSGESMEDSPSRETTNPVQQNGKGAKGKGKANGDKSQDGEGDDEDGKSPVSSTGVGLDRSGTKSKATIGGESSKIVAMDLSTELASKPQSSSKTTPNYTYIAKMPDNLVKKIVVPCEKFHALYQKSITVGSSKISDAQLGLLRSNAKAYFSKLTTKVAFMSQDFERRKAASEFARTMTHDTGVLDTKKLHKISFSDNVFLSMETLKVGKNHGLCMYVDWSSSMSDKITATVEQVLTLIAFCRRVNLPYRVYLFSESSIDPAHPVVSPTDVRATNLVNMTGCSLFEVLSSDRGSKWSDDIANLIALTYSVSGGRKVTDGIDSVFSTRELATISFSNHDFGLTGTPLHGAMWAMPAVSNAFVRENKLEVVSTIILSDGESNYSSFPNSTSNTTEIVVDSTTGSRDNLGWSGGGDCQTNLVNVLAKRIRFMTSGSVLGFYMLSPSYDCWYDTTAHIVLPTTELQKRNLAKDKTEFDKNKFLSVTSKGFDSYFFISTAKSKSAAVAGSLDAIITDNRAADRQIATQFVQRITNAWTKETKSLLGR